MDIISRDLTWIFAASHSPTPNPQKTAVAHRVRRLLLALANILRLCPRTKPDLAREMSSSFPHHRTSPPAAYAWYVHSCLQAVHLVPTLEGPVLCLLVDRALDMDVEIKINDGGRVVLDAGGGGGGDDDDDGAAEDAAVEALGGNRTAASRKRSYQQISQESSSLSLAAAANGSGGDPGAPGGDESVFDDSESDHVLEVSERLDSLMEALYRRVESATAFDPTSLRSCASAVLSARRLHRHLDSVFDGKVRTTDRSKFVQFVFLVLFGRENDALEAAARIVAQREVGQPLIADGGGAGDPTSAAVPAASVSAITETDPLYRGFSAKLIDFFYDPSSAGDVPRQAAACYLASFVSRATYVCPETVCECVAALLRWAEVYVSAQAKTGGLGGGAGVGGMRRAASTSSLGATQNTCEAHALFYTACQAAFYIMCFRGAEALKYYREACRNKDDPESSYAEPESVDIGPERWKFLCGHALQPLRYCLESVRLEFLHLAEDLDLFVCPNDDGGEDAAKKFLETLWSTSTTKQGKKSPHGPNKAAAPKRRRSTLISTAATQEKKRLDGGVGGLGRGSNPLDSFFPFDPYLLQKSYSHVHPYYRNWEDCILTIEEDENDVQFEAEGVLDDDVNSDISDDEDVDVEDEDEEESDSEEDDEDEEDEQNLMKKSSEASRGFASLHEDNHFEMEVRRSRAMSTGSQCSW